MPRTYRLPRWGWGVQLGGFITIVLFFAVMSIRDHTYLFPLVMFGLVGAFGIHFLWTMWPLVIVLHDDDTVEFQTMSGCRSMPVADLQSVRFGKGVWLYHAQGKYAFSASPTNAVLWDFLSEVKKRHPDFQIDSSYIDSMISR